MVSAPAGCCSFLSGLPSSLLYVVFWIDQERTVKFQSDDYTTRDKKSNAGVLEISFLVRTL